MRLEQFKKITGIVDIKGDIQALSDIELRFSTDTRDMRRGDCFIAIDGKRYRPLDHIDGLKDCLLIIYENTETNVNLVSNYKGKIVMVAVDNIIVFMQSLAQTLAKEFTARGGKIIAVGGSNGKTTTKDMLYHLLSSIGAKAVRTLKNNNNHIGVPLTLFQIDSDDEFCVLELGSNHPGEIKALCEIACPNYGVVTNIGDSHLEFFKDREGVMKEEGYLYTAIFKESKAECGFFLNLDDPYLSRLKKRDGVMSYGSNENSDFIVKAYNDHVDIIFDSASIKIENSDLLGEHNFMNLGVAFVVASYFVKGKKESLLKAAESFVPKNNRSQWMSLGDSRVFLDAYNANPSSMKAALSAFSDFLDAQTKDLSAVILGDMNELGENSREFHAEIGRFCSHLGFKHMFFIGRYSKAYMEGGCAGETYTSAHDFIEKNRDFFKKYNHVFIKGSRSLQLESILDIT